MEREKTLKWNSLTTGKFEAMNGAHCKLNCPMFVCSVFKENERVNVLS